MDEDDIAVRGFRSYFGALGLLERGCGWDRRTAHAELMDAVNDGRVRRKSDPNPPRPKYDSGNWNERRWLPSLAPSLMDLDGNWTHFPGGDGKPAFTIGSPGGSTIITTVLQTIFNHVDLGMPMDAALNAPRISERNGEASSIEPGFPGSAQARALEGFGHRWEARPEEIGAANALVFNPDGTVTAVSEGRRHGVGTALVQGRAH